MSETKSSTKDDQPNDPERTIKSMAPVGDFFMYQDGPKTTIGILNYGSNFAPLWDLTDRLQKLLLATVNDQRGLRTDENNIKDLDTLFQSEAYGGAFRSLADLYLPASDKSTRPMMDHEDTQKAAASILQDFDRQINLARYTGEISPEVFMEAAKKYVRTMVADVNSSPSRTMAGLRWRNSVSSSEHFLKFYLSAKALSGQPFSDNEAQQIKDFLSGINYSKSILDQTSVGSLENANQTAYLLGLKFAAAAVQQLATLDPSKERADLYMNYIPEARYCIYKLNEHIKESLEARSSDINLTFLERDLATGKTHVTQMTVLLSRDKGDDWIGYREGDMLAMDDPGLASQDLAYLRQWAILSSVDVSNASKASSGKTLGTFKLWSNWLASGGKGPTPKKIRASTSNYIKLIKLVDFAAKFGGVTKKTKPVIDYLSALAGLPTDAVAPNSVAAAPIDRSKMGDDGSPLGIDVDGLIWAPGTELPSLEAVGDESVRREQGLANSQGDAVDSAAGQDDAQASQRAVDTANGDTQSGVRR